MSGTSQYSTGIPEITHPSEDIRGSRSQELAGRHIVLGITGSIAAVETVKLIRELIRHGAFVTPVMSSEGRRIIHPNAIEFAAGVPPITELTGAVEHVALCGERSQRADLLLIAPATANTISKMACGIDDSPVTTFATTAIGSGLPVLIVPAMHAAMYRHPILEDNIEKLGGLENVVVMKPRMDEKKAKFPRMEAIVLEIMRTLHLSRKDAPWRGRSVLIISGSTVESMDDMRVLTNRSSGTTGMELCRRSHILGARTVLWYGRGDVSTPAAAGLEVRRYGSTASLAGMVDDTDLEQFDVIINCAAISDYRPERTGGKIPSGKDDLTLRFGKNPKIIEAISNRIGKSAAPPVLVGFKAESGIPGDDLIEKAKARMADVGMDIVVANDLRNVKSDETTAFIITREKAPRRVTGQKSRLAGALFDTVESMWKEQGVGQ